MEYGITMAEVRVGGHAERVEMTLDMALREVGLWLEKRERRDVGETEISVRPCLPKCWDGKWKMRA